MAKKPATEELIDLLARFTNDSKVFGLAQEIVGEIEAVAVNAHRKLLSERLAGTDGEEAAACGGPEFTAPDFLAGIHFAAELVGDEGYDV